MTSYNGSNATAVTNTKVVSGDLDAYPVSGDSAISSLMWSKMGNAENYFNPYPILVRIGDGSVGTTSFSFGQPYAEVTRIGYRSMIPNQYCPHNMGPSPFGAERSVCKCLMNTWFQADIPITGVTTEMYTLGRTYYQPLPMTVINESVAGPLFQNRLGSIAPWDGADLSSWLAQDEGFQAKFGDQNCAFWNTAAGPPAAKLPVDVLTATVSTTIQGPRANSAPTPEPEGYPAPPGPGPTPNAEPGSHPDSYPSPNHDPNPNDDGSGGRDSSSSQGDSSGNGGGDSSKPGSQSNTDSSGDSGNTVSSSNTDLNENGADGGTGSSSGSSGESGTQGGGQQDGGQSDGSQSNGQPGSGQSNVGQQGNGQQGGGQPNSGQQGGGQPNGGQQGVGQQSGGEQGGGQPNVGQQSSGQQGSGPGGPESSSPSSGSSSDSDSDSGSDSSENLPPPSAPFVITAGSHTISGTVQGSTAAVIAGTTITAGGSPASAGGALVSVHPGAASIAVNDESQPLPTPLPPPAAAAPPAPIATVGSHTITALPGASEVYYAGTTLSQNGPHATLDNTEVYVGSSGLVIGTSTIPIPTPPPLPLSPQVEPTNVFTLGGQTFTANPSAIAVGGTTLTAGGSAVTISGTPISLGSAGLVVASTTHDIPLGALPSSTMVVGDETFTIRPTAIEVGGTTLSAGGPGITVSGTPISLGPSGLVVAGSTVPYRHGPLTATGGSSSGDVGDAILAGFGPSTTADVLDASATSTATVEAFTGAAAAVGKPWETALLLSSLIGVGWLVCIGLWF